MNKTRFAACLTLLALLVSCMMASPASAATRIKKVYIKHDCAEIAVYGGEAAVAFPEGIRVIREVTGEQEYTNPYIAKIR